MTTTRTGIVFRPQSAPEGLRAVVEAVDQADVDELWLWEDCFLEGGISASTAALMWSERITVGIGLLPVPLRNPALAAMEIATIARLAPGRFTPALGHGVLPWMRQVGAAVESPMTLLREYATAVRDLLAGETVDVAGRYVTLDQVALDWPPAEPPHLLIGGRGPKTVQLAGEVSDGVLLDASAGPDDVRRARELVGHARIVTFAELDTRVGDLPARMHDTSAALVEAGADTVVFQAPTDAPDPRPFLA